MFQPLFDSGLHPQQMKQTLPDFLTRIQQLIEILGLDMSQYQLDHIAMRINDVELAKLAHNAWLSDGQEISSTQINGRPIIVVAFDQPLQAGHWQIECLELPYPAAGKSYPLQSWEHVEFVVPSSAQNAQAYLSDVKQRFPKLADKWSELASLGVKVKLSSPKGEGERLNNPTIAFKWQEVCIKLHPHSLQTIIASESAN